MQREGYNESDDKYKTVITLPNAGFYDIVKDYSSGLKIKFPSRELWDVLVEYDFNSVLKDCIGSNIASQYKAEYIKIDDNGVIMMVTKDDHGFLTKKVYLTPVSTSYIISTEPTADDT